ncbi:MAG: D-alanine--D-alanine ligase, partial [Candidatus Omnitrophica bacterium]|nr:D-alanine--D-alanine ligase [Candidatus Omnitrophota bacterium]
QIVYTGSDAKASRLAMNKVLTQKMLAEKGIPVPKYCVVTKEDVFDSEKAWDVLEGGPVVVKPAAEGSSIGVSIVQQKDQLAAAVDLAFQYGTEVLLEKFISGREMTVGILDEQALPLVEIRPGNSFFDFTAKYQKGMTEYIVPAEVSKEQSERIQGIALEVYKFLGCRDFARLDFMLDAQGNPYFLEVNTIPGFTSTSLLPMAVNEKGIGFGELCLMIARLAAKRKQAGAAKGTS